MAARARTWIALIRAIGPLTHVKMSMAALRAASAENGLGEVRTVLATGNILFSSGDGEKALARTLAGVIGSFGLDNEVYLRRPEELAAALAFDPFPDAAKARPNHLLVLFLDKDVTKEALDRLGDYRGPERFEAKGRELFIDYAEGVGRSKLTPALLERRLGQKGTARNWNTVRKLLDAARGG